MTDRMLAYIGRAARNARRERKVKLVRIGAAIDKSEASMSRFERGQLWRELDAVVATYAAELGLEPEELWADALELWNRDS